MNKNNRLKNTFVTVTICSLNGGKRIGDCLKSIVEQTYEKENFEIIVVDDGSIDNTSDIANKYKAQVIRFNENKGIPVARNAAFKAAKGAIVVSIDDDCIANSEWLENLVNVFSDENIIAAGGKIVSYSRETIAQRYLEATGYGNPARRMENKNVGIIRRLFAYFLTMLKPIMFEIGVIDVSAVYTANAAYRRDSVIEIGGFDEKLKTSEDSDLSARLLKFGKRIVYVPDSVVSHRHYEKISKVILEPYKRSKNTFDFYLKERKIPPIFPMPLIYLVISLVGFLLFYKSMVFFFMFLLFLPILLYWWWPYRFVREKRIEYLFYPYLQLIVEGGVLFGLLRAVFK